MQSWIILPIIVEEYHLMEKVCGVLAMALLEMLFLMLIIVHHLSHCNDGKNNFLVLGEGPTEGINDSAGATGKKKY